MRGADLKGSGAGGFSPSLQSETASTDFESVRGGRGCQKDGEGDVQAFFVRERMRIYQLEIRIEGYLSLR